MSDQTLKSTSNINGKASVFISALLALWRKIYLGVCVERLRPGRETLQLYLRVAIVDF